MFRRRGSDSSKYAGKGKMDRIPACRSLRCDLKFGDGCWKTRQDGWEPADNPGSRVSDGCPERPQFGLLVPQERRRDCICVSRHHNIEKLRSARAARVGQ